MQWLIEHALPARYNRSLDGLPQQVYPQPGQPNSISNQFGPPRPVVGPSDSWLNPRGIHMPSAVDHLEQRLDRAAALPVPRGGVVRHTHNVARAATPGAHIRIIQRG